jgi:hypothetical protein
VTDPRLMAVPFLAVVCLAVAPARADSTKAQCIASNASAQDLRRDGKLALAREQLRACAAPACPSIVREDCTKLMSEVETAQPTVHFDVKDAAGGPVGRVDVRVDGRPVEGDPLGTAVPLDPGSRVITVTAADHAPFAATVVVVEGEKARQIAIVLQPAVVVSAARIGEAPPPIAAHSGMAAQKAAGLVGGGVGVAGLVVGGIFGALALSDKSAQTAACNASPCTGDARARALDDHSSARSDGTVSTIGFVAGGALLAGGLALFFTAHTRERASTITLLPGLAPHGGELTLGGTF